MARWFWTWRTWTFAALLMVLALTTVRPQHTAYASCGPNNICWSDLFHDSRDPLYRTPTGPAPMNSQVTLRFRTAASDVQSVFLRVYNTKLGANNFYSMNRVATVGAYDYWAYTLNTGATPNILYYWFRAVDGTAEVYYQDDLAAADFNHRLWGGSGQPYGGNPDYSWALTVYDPSFTTPDWVKNGVFYQIFPDRFRDGNPANNLPAGEFFYNEAGGTIFRSDPSYGNSGAWNTAICDPRAITGDGCQGSWSRNFYGGDLQGIQDKLAYLKGLGVTVIYMTPVFEAPSNHKYDARDFSVVDDNFGGDAALTALINAAHAEGMYVVLDGVFNHVSSDSPYFDRYNRYATVGACESTTSPYLNLFKPFSLTGSGPAPCSDGRYYTGWFGFDSLPEFESATPGGLARAAIWDGGITHPSGKFAEIGTYWITDFDIDGWRLDVANDVDPSGSFGSNDYWENFRDKVKAANPDAYIVGEFWGIGTQWISGGLASGYTSSGSNPGEWDAVMNYQQSAALFGFWRDSALDAENDFNSGSLPGKIVPHTPSMFATRYYDLYERYPEEAFYAMMNLNGSHDTQRALWLLDETIPNSPPNGTAYPTSANHYEVGQPGAEAVANLMGYSLMQYTLPGAPQIYYGTEVGLVNPAYYHGGKWEDDPYNRAPFPWGDETGTPFYTHMTEGNSVRDALLSHFTTLGTTRNAHPSLRTGKFVFSLVDDASKQLGYYRYMPDGSDAAVVLINRNTSAASMTINLGQHVPVGATFVNVFDSANYVTTPGSGSTTQLTVPSVAANSGILLVLSSGAYEVPPKPAVSATVLSGTEVELNWLDMGTHSYAVYRSRFAGGGARTLIATLPDGTTTYTDSGLSSGRTYYYTVEAISAAGVTSGPSNEVSATPFYDLSGSYRNVQWPSSLTHVISTLDSTDDVYGAIYLAGVTDAQPDPVDGLTAQLGYGAAGSNPSSDASWRWVAAAPNVPAATGSNDEFYASLRPDAVGTYSYTYRYSSDGGQTWFYAFDFPGDLCDEATQTGYVLCPLTVNPSSDTTAPAAVTLNKRFDTPTEVGLGWSLSSDDVAVHGYRVYRSADGGMTYQMVADLEDDAADSYTDSNVSANQTYKYIVRAYDTSFNFSADSNVVDAETVASMVDVTFSAVVPPFTQVSNAVQVIGGHPTLSNWGSGVDMTEVAAGVWEVTLSFPEGTTFPYKYRRDGTWDKVEKALNGYDEIPDRMYTVGYAEDGPFVAGSTVLNWRDLLVTGFTPADGDVDVSVGSTVVVSFNKSLQPSSTFAVVDSSSAAVSGTFSLSVDELSLTFTPDALLAQGETFTVTVGSSASSYEGGRFFTDSFSFTTKPYIITNLLVNPGFESALRPNWRVINRTLDGRRCDANARTGLCSFRFVGSAGENARLVQVSDLTTTTLAVGDQLVLSGWFRTTRPSRLMLVMTVTYADNTTAVRKVAINGAGPYRRVQTPVLSLTRTDVLRVQTRIRNTSLSKNSWVDDLELNLLQPDLTRGVVVLPDVVPDVPDVDAALPLPDPIEGQDE